MVRATLQGAVAPLAGQAVEARDGYGELLSNFPLSRFTENWLYSRGGGWGICWPRDVKPACVQGTLCFACALGDLLPGQEAVIEPVTVALGAFASWRSFCLPWGGRRPRSALTAWRCWSAGATLCRRMSDPGRQSASPWPAGCRLAGGSCRFGAH